MGPGADRAGADGALAPERGAPTGRGGSAELSSTEAGRAPPARPAASPARPAPLRLGGRVTWLARRGLRAPGGRGDPQTHGRTSDGTRPRGPGAPGPGGLRAAGHGRAGGPGAQAGGGEAPGARGQRRAGVLPGGRR